MGFGLTLVSDPGDEEGVLSRAIVAISEFCHNFTSCHHADIA